MALSRAGAVVLCLCLAASACGPAQRGAFSQRGYSSSYGYDVPYAAGTRRVLPAGWQLDNYRQGRTSLELKDSPEYVTTYEFDDNDDGHSDHSMSAAIYALRYKHAVHSGVIWLRDVPMSGDLRRKDLRVLMQSYIDEMSGANYEVVRLGDGAGVVRSKEYVATVLSEGPATVAGRPAYIAMIEVTNANQPGGRVRQVELVILRAPREELGDSDPKRPGRAGYPVLMVAGYSNMPMDFAPGLADFHDLLGRLTIDGQSGLEIGQPAMPPDAPAAPAAVPAAPAAPAVVPPPAPRT